MTALKWKLSKHYRRLKIMRMWAFFWFGAWALQVGIIAYEAFVGEYTNWWSYILMPIIGLIAFTAAIKWPERR